MVNPTLWYESTLLWGVIALLFATLLTVIAMISPNIKIVIVLLLISWLLAIAATWIILKSTTNSILVKIIISAIVSIMVAGILYIVYTSFGSPAPRVSIEPEEGQLILPNQPPGFILTVINNGIDIDHVRYDLVYFVAIGQQNKIKIHKIFREVNHPLYPHDIPMRTNQKELISFNVGGFIEQAFHKFQEHYKDLSMLTGVKITLKFKRYSDQKDFSFTRIYELTSTAGQEHFNLLHTGTNGKIPEGDKRAFLNLNEVIPYLESEKDWLKSSFRIGPQGIEEIRVNDATNNSQTTKKEIISTPSPTVMSPSTGNLKERAIALTDDILGELYSHGVPQHLPIQNSIKRENLMVIRSMPKDKDDYAQWKRHRSGKFMLLYYKRLHTIRDEFSKLHFRDERLDDFISSVDEHKPDEDHPLPPMEIADVAKRLRELANKLPSQ